MNNSRDNAVPRPERSRSKIGDVSRTYRVVKLMSLVLIGIFIVGVVLGFVLVGRHGGGPLQSLDNWVGNWYLNHRGSLVGISKFVAKYLDAAPLGVICVVASVAAFLAWRTTRAFIPFVAYLGGEIEVFAIRAFIHRPRPLTANYPAHGSVPGVHETSYSFPSGHATAVSAVLFGVLGCWALSHRAWWPWLVALIGSLFVCDTRLVLGVHWFSDVAFGLLFGAVWGITVAVLSREIEVVDITALLRPRRARH